MPGTSYPKYQAANQAGWLGTSFLLATCTFTPLYGRLCTAMGRKGAQHVTLAFAGLGTLACGSAPNINFLIAVRFVAGIRGARIVTSDMYSMRGRGLTQGIAAVVKGGFLGGAIMDRLGWRYAFLLQLPFYLLSFILTAVFLNYQMLGRSKDAKQVLKRIDYGGTFTLLILVGSSLLFLATKYNGEYSWSHPYVWSSLICMVISLFGFVLVELYVSPEPIMAPFLLHQRIPVLVSASNFLVSICNLAVTYFFPVWFETVKLDSTSSAGAHVAPNSVAMSFGLLFAGWMMHRTGKYKVLNVIFGIFPTLAAVLIASLTTESSEWLQWIIPIPLGFGNSVVLQTTLIALLASVDRPSMAVAMGFVQLFHGLGQVSGVAIFSTIFQSLLNKELHARITGSGSEELIEKVKHSSEIVRHLPPESQVPVRESHAHALRAVFIMAACSAFAAFLVRLPIPELSMDEDAEQRSGVKSEDDGTSPTPHLSVSPTGSLDEEGVERRGIVPRSRPPRPGAQRRMSTYQHTPLDVERGRSARKLRNSRGFSLPQTRLRLVTYQATFLHFGSTTQAIKEFSSQKPGAKLLHFRGR
ncbi:MFS general substrate transporter [Serendipita vermifera]|nr:MFS general substrate transporter [Serendipita vermifera]